MKRIIFMKVFYTLQDTKHYIIPLYCIAVLLYHTCMLPSSYLAKALLRYCRYIVQEEARLV